MGVVKLDILSLQSKKFPPWKGSFFSGQIKSLTLRNEARTSSDLRPGGKDPLPKHQEVMPVYKTSDLYKVRKNFDKNEERE